MMKMTIVVQSCFAVFLLLMVSNVNSIEYHQVTGSVEKKIIDLAERLNQQLERVNEKQLSCLSKWIDIERLQFFLYEIINTESDYCLTCEGISRDCISLLFRFLFLNYLMIFFICLSICCLPWPELRGMADYLASVNALFAHYRYEDAKQLDCLWANLLD